MLTMEAVTILPWPQPHHQDLDDTLFTGRGGIQHQPIRAKISAVGCAQALHHG